MKTPTHVHYLLLTGLTASALCLTGCFQTTSMADSDTGSYICKRTDAPIVVDGTLDDAAWAAAGQLEFIMPETFDQPLSKTIGRVMYDSDYIYMSFIAYDQDIWATFRERDADTFYEDVLEAFFKTSPQGEPYYEFEFSPLGTIFDAYIAKRRAAGTARRWMAWDADGIKAVAQVEGTLGNYEDVDEHWTLEVAIPFKDMPSLKGTSPSAGDEWIFHLARYDYSVYLPDGRELTSCAPLTKVSFHQTNRWMRLVFE